MSEKQLQSQGRVHRVGSFTLGLMLVLFGLLFLLRIFFPALSYGMICRLWPCALICLGAEVLAASADGKQRFVYDVWAVVLLIVLLAFAMGMGFCSEFLIKQVAGEIIVW